MRAFLIIITLGVSLSSIAQNSNMNTYIGEMMYQGKTPIAYSKFDYDFWLRGTDDTLNISILPKENYYTGEKGTEIIFYVNRNSLSKMKNKVAFLNGYSYIVLENKQKKIKAPFKDVPIDFSAVKPINETTFKLTQAFAVGEPELFSLVMMLNQINKQLDNKSTRNDGFSDVVDDLEEFIDKYKDDKRIPYTTLIDFYKLFVFLDTYVPTNSFFNEEARKLNERITVINKQLTDTTQNDISSMQNKELLEELLNSNDVYSEYQKEFARINDYYSRIKLILFLKAR